jgi:hypothetical protein
MRPLRPSAAIDAVKAWLKADRPDRATRTLERLATSGVPVPAQTLRSLRSRVESAAIEAPDPSD